MHPSVGVPVIPDVIQPTSLREYLEVMTRAVFQAGVSWRQIAEQWGAYRSAFHQFDPQRVAAYDDFDIEQVLKTPGILRSPRKVRATVANARAMLEAERQHGNFEAFVRSFGSYAELAAGFRKRFSFMGEMNVWYVLFRTGHSVPRFEPWVQTIRGDHPRMREMVERARAEGRSPEC